VEGQIPGGCQFADECLVRVGVRAAKAVVHVKNGRRDAKFMECGQQENGIRAAGDGNADSSPVSNRGRNLIDHSSILRVGGGWSALPPRSGFRVRPKPNSRSEARPDAEIL
jgi:hypothetical protein